jgi:hypothetical protein
MKKQVYDFIAKEAEKASGLTWGEITGKSIRRDLFFARMAITIKCLELFDIETVAKLIHRDRTTIYHYLKRYNIDYKYNKKFKEIADKL